MIGERVRHARLYHGWSQTQLGKQTGVSQAAISDVERGKPVSDELLDAIARETQFSRAFFEKGPLPDLPKGSLRHRKQATARVRDDERIRAHVRQAIEVLNDLENAEPVKAVPVRIQPVAASETVDSGFIEALALRAREWMGIGPDDPIPNVTRAIERTGVAVIGSAQEIVKHEGASYWPDFPFGRPIICVSRGRPGDRARLSLSHEFGHLVLHQLREIPSEQAEQEAFRFGGALLLPEHRARKVIPQPVTLRELALVKAKYGIAIQALIRRCLDLGLIDTHRRTSLEKQISARGWRKNEPVIVPTEAPALVERLVELSKGTTDVRRLHDAFGIPPMAVRDLLATGTDDVDGGAVVSFRRPAVRKAAKRR
jgi:Zn-dependent peptidase ImmA (M78 family)/transcriptional regulator with XRE-family HTH domain